MFQQNLCIPILRSLRFLPHSNRSKTNKSNPFAFVKEKLPALPAIETITPRDRGLDQLVETHLSRRKVTYGDYDFFECKEGYILCYINGILRKKAPEKAFYGVCYGTNHPLNVQGPVKGVQTLPHAKDHAILSAIQAFPNIEAKKLCICTNCTRTIKMMGRLQEYSENGYRRSDGNVLEIKDTYVALTAAIRLRNDLQLRFLFTPSDACTVLMNEPLRMATLASKLE